MIFRPTPSGGRVASGTTPWGDFSVEWDAQGRIVNSEIEFATPANHERYLSATGSCYPGIKGVGDHLHDIIVERFGERPDDERCGCRTMILKMNLWGPDGCEQHFDEIVDHLMDQTARIGRWYLRHAAKLPGARRVAEGMVREAIERGRAEVLQ